MERTILKPVEFKLYLTAAQERTLEEWLRQSCWVYNQALEHRIKAYKRRKESVGFNAQCALLTGWRKGMPRMQAVPALFLRDALRRVDRGFKAFFRRLRTGEKPGFPRFRPRRRYNSLEYLMPDDYAGDGHVRIPKLGRVETRGRFDITGEQRLLRIIRRASGWYAQVLIDTGEVIPAKVTPQTAVGIDVGLSAFATTDAGEKVENPRFYRRAEGRFRHACRQVSRRRKGSNNRRKAVKRLAREHERVAAQRRDFAHQRARELVNKYDVIGFEKLSVKALARTRLAKSILDAAWSLFTGIVTRKAECAGKWAVPVDAARTSQECPWCGRVRKKSLSEREHRCDCNPGHVIDRDMASGLVIRARAVRVVAAEYCGGIDLCAALAGDVSRPVEAGSSHHWHSKMLW